MGPSLDYAESLEFATAGQIVGTLTQFGIENVVLNSCWSACSWYSRTANLSHQLLKKGAKSVMGMWGKANELVVSKFLDHFYRSLLLRRRDFETAVYEGRAALRADRNRWPNNQRFADDFLCIQYLRGPISTPFSQTQPRVRGFRGLLLRLRPSNSSLRAVSSHDSDCHSSREIDPSFPSALSLPSSNRESASRSTSRSPLHRFGDEMRPNVIPLENLFLKLELCMMQHSLIWAYDVPNRQEANERRMRDLACLWLDTGFVCRTVVYRADAFKSSSIGPPDIDLPEKSNRRKNRHLPHRESSRTLYVVENVDRIVGGVNQNETDMKTAKQNLKSFLNNLDWDLNYVIFTTHNGEKWWKNQEWRGKQVGYWWSFQQHFPGEKRRHTRFRDA
jgi:hypothetical protein